MKVTISAFLFIDSHIGDGRNVATFSTYTFFLYFKGGKNVTQMQKNFFHFIETVVKMIKYIDSSLC